MGYEIVLGVLLAIFAVILTLYGIILGFLNEEIVLLMVSAKVDDSKNKSFLKDFTNEYEKTIYLFLVTIFLTICILIFIRFDVFIKVATEIENKMAVIIRITITLYIYIVTRTLAEILSTVFNTINFHKTKIANVLIKNLKEKKDNKGG